MRRVVLVGLILVVGGAGCASQERSAVRPSQVAAWTAYRAEVEPSLLRVLGPTDGLADACEAERRSAPAPRFGIDLRATLRACTSGDIAGARQQAHRQIDRVTANDAAIDHRN